MTSILDIATGDLPATKTHPRRRWAFVPAIDPTRPGLGTVTIVQGKEADSYDIDLIDGEYLFVQRDGGAEIYALPTDRAGQPRRCSCKGYGFTRTCKHVDTLRELIADGSILATV